jgi:hypothetical protein
MKIAFKIALTFLDTPMQFLKLVPPSKMQMRQYDSSVCNKIGTGLGHSLG